MKPRTLVVIPARGGSRGIPGKNIKPFLGVPLIHYTIRIARSIFEDQDICVTTDSNLIKESVENIGLQVPFRRPNHLATDVVGTYEVLMHAINFYEKKSIKYEQILLLQPTTPIRNKEHILDMLKMKMDNPYIDMVVSVKESKENPYFTLFEENELGFIEKSKSGNYVRRQDCPKVYTLNGSAYLISIDSLKKGKIDRFKNVKKYVMEDEIYNIDLDIPSDWIIAEDIVKKQNKKI